MNCKDANTIPIDHFLSRLGIEPVKTRAHSKWYLSPLRTEKTASFKVDTHRNQWYDFGLGAGGDLVSLGTRMADISVSDFLSQLSRQNLSITVRPAPMVEPVSEWEILNVRSISHPALVAYLKLRCIPIATAKRFCAEVHYANDKHKFFAIGFRNDCGGYEVRNSVFKGCLGKKDITTLQRDDSSVMLFEGFMDFLSANEIFEASHKSSVIILNSVTQLPKAIDKLETLAPQKIESYFNNDDTGKNCTLLLRDSIPHTIDRAPLYHPHNDINDLLKSKHNQTLSM